MCAAANFSLKFHNRSYENEETESFKNSGFSALPASLRSQMGGGIV